MDLFSYSRSLFLKGESMSASKKLLSTGVPIIGSLILNITVTYTDFLMVAPLGSSTLAAVGMAGQIFGLVYSIAQFIYMGQGALLTRFVGSKSYKRASVLVSSMFWFSMIFSFVVMAIFFIFSPYIFTIFKASSDVSTTGMAYLNILLFSIPFLALNTVFHNTITSVGDTKTPLYLDIGAAVANAIFNYIFIFGHFGFTKMGVEGAALSTVMVKGVELCAFIYLIYSRYQEFRLKFIYSKSLIKRVLKVGVPAMLDRLSWNLTSLIFGGIVLTLGTASYTAFQIGQKIEGLSFMPGLGFAIAASILIGQEIGKKDISMAQKVVKVASKYSSLIMFTITIAIIIFADELLSLFTQDLEVKELAKLYIIVVGLSQIPLAMEFVYSLSLKGAGDTKATFTINMASMWGIRILGTLISVYIFNSLVGVFVAIALDTLVKAALFYLRFQKGVWKSLKV